MQKKILCILLAFSCLCLVSCSVFSDLLDKAGAGDLKDKLDTAWSEVGKDVIKDIADSLWREYGFGKSLDWPETGNGAHVPKFKGGATEYSFISEEGDCGCIYLSDVSKDEYEKYITGLEEIGYKQSLVISLLDELYGCDGLYIGLLKDDNMLYICYGESVTELDDVYKAAIGQKEE